MYCSALVELRAREAGFNELKFVVLGALSAFLWIAFAMFSMYDILCQP